MKKLLILTLVVMIMAAPISLVACTSKSPVVGTYKLVSVYMDNGTQKVSYDADGTNPAVNRNSFTLELKKNYTWNMNIMLPGLSEHEDGKWKEDNNTYTLHEDKDDPVIELTFDGEFVRFVMSENGYALNVTLEKQFYGSAF